MTAVVLSAVRFGTIKCAESWCAQKELALLPDRIDYVVHLAAAISGAPGANAFSAAFNVYHLPHLLPTPYEMTDKMASSPFITRMPDWCLICCLPHMK